MPARHGIACANGTAALDIAVQVLQVSCSSRWDRMAVLIPTCLQALGLGQDDEVRTSWLSLARPTHLEWLKEQHASAHVNSTIVRQVFFQSDAQGQVWYHLVSV